MANKAAAGRSSAVPFSLEVWSLTVLVVVHSEGRCAFTGASTSVLPSIDSAYHLFSPAFWSAPGKDRFRFSTARPESGANAMMEAANRADRLLDISQPL